MIVKYPLSGGMTRFGVPFPYLSRSHVVVMLDGNPVAAKWLNDSEIEVTDPFGGPVLGAELVVMRVTPDTVDFADIRDASNLTAAQLKRMRLQLLYLLQERSGGVAGYVGTAVGAAGPGIIAINDNLARIDAILAALTANLQTLDELQADVVFAKNEAISLRDTLMAEIEDTDNALAAVNNRFAAAEIETSNAHARITTETGARIDADDALSVRIDQTYADFQTADGSLSASITAVDAARASAEAAHAARLVSLESKVDTGESTVSALVNEAVATLVSADEAIASQVTTLQATVDAQGDTLAQVSQESSATADSMGNVLAQTVLKTVARSDGKKAVAGIGLAATSDGTVAQSEIILMADRLLVVPPGEPDAPLQPLLVQGTVNGSPTTVFPANKFGDQSVGANVLVDGTITTRKLLVTGSNLIANSAFVTGDFSNWRKWASDDLQAIVPATSSGVPPGAPTTNVCRFSNPTSGAAEIAIWAAEKAFSDAGADKDGFSVQEGETYFASIAAARSSDYAASSLRIRAYFLLTDGSRPAITMITLAPSALASTSWAVFKGTFQVPANAVRCWLYVYSAGHTTGKVYWTNLRCQRMTDGDLIVDGVVKANHIDSRGLSIKDDAGNVILSAGLGLDVDRLPNKRTLANTGPNLIANPDFTNDTPGTAPRGWTLHVSGTAINASISGTTSPASYTPPWDPYGKFMYSGVNDTTSYVRLTHTALIGVDPSKTYCLSTWVRPYSTIGDPKVYLGIECYDESATYIGVVYVATALVLTSYVWQELSGTIGPSGSRSFLAGTVFVKPLWYGSYRQPGRTMASRFCFNEGTVPATNYAPMDRSAVSGMNPINSGNVSTYIANASIGTAQVGVLTAGNLTVQALSGTINGGASSGGRVVVSSNRVEVYDTSNALRVRMGYLL